MKQENKLENSKRKITLATKTELEFLNTHKGGIYRNLSYEEGACAEADRVLLEQINLHVDNFFKP